MSITMEGGRILLHLNRPPGNALPPRLDPQLVVLSPCEALTVGDALVDAAIIYYTANTDTEEEVT